MYWNATLCEYNRNEIPTATCARIVPPLRSVGDYTTIQDQVEPKILSPADGLFGVMFHQLEESRNNGSDPEIAPVPQLLPTMSVSDPLGNGRISPGKCEQSSSLGDHHGDDILDTQHQSLLHATDTTISERLEGAIELVSREGLGLPHPESLVDIGYLGGLAADSVPISNEGVRSQIAIEQRPPPRENLFRDGESILQMCPSTASWRDPGPLSLKSMQETLPIIVVDSPNLTGFAGSKPLRTTLPEDSKTLGIIKGSRRRSRRRSRRTKGT